MLYSFDRRSSSEMPPSPQLLLAGGYGLFLKQKWLLTDAAKGTPSIVNVHQWNDQTPRVTKDLDFVVELNLIASPEDQNLLEEALTKNEFTVVEQNKRWQFEKQVATGQKVVVDFHAPPPLSQRNDVRVESRRVKPNPSLKQTGIHGRENREALGCELFPFLFGMAGVEIAIPNPVTFAFMKLVAMRERRAASQDSAKTPTERNAEDAQARKHANDVFRVIAMTTREENDLAANVLKATRDTAVFAHAADTCNEFFMSGGAWGTQIVAPQWRKEDFQLIQATLVRWFS